MNYILSKIIKIYKFINNSEINKRFYKIGKKNSL